MSSYSNQPVSKTRNLGMKRPKGMEDTQAKPVSRSKHETKPKRRKLSPVIRREHASTFTASVDMEVKRRMDILKQSTLRPIVIYYEPADAKMPTHIKWRIYPFKNNRPLPVMYVHRQSSYVIGRNADVCDIQIRHCSCSNQHAVLQYREVLNKNNTRVVRPFIMDLRSMNKTMVNGVTIAPLTYVQLFEKDVIEFGLSTREYILLHQNSECLQ